MACLAEKKVEAEENSDSDDADYQPPLEEKPAKVAPSRKRRAPPLRPSNFIDDEEDVERDGDNGAKKDETDEIQKIKPDPISNSPSKRARVEGKEVADQIIDQGSEPLRTPVKVRGHRAPKQTTPPTAHLWQELGH